MAESDIVNQDGKSKLAYLEENLKELGDVAVAFSGGVDSTFLLKVAHNVLGDRVVAITARSCLFPERELEEAKAFCMGQGIRHSVFDSDEMEREEFCSNPPNRCYLCKKQLFLRMKEIALKNNTNNIAEGSNLDDNGDYRPGLAAVKELDIRSPLREAGLTKAEIRALSREMGLSVWEKPSFACLASRFAYGESITREKLSMVDRAEALLREQGFHQMRVRIHGRMARIEVLPEEFGMLIERSTREEIVSKMKSFGFTYISMDLAGYRTGSMNETLSHVSPYSVVGRSGADGER